MSDKPLPVAVIGAGPVGLAAAAQLVQRGETPIVFEAGAAVGRSIREWAHVQVFSTWEFNVDRNAARMLAAAGWAHPPKDGLPTGGELVAQYLEPLAALPALRPHIHLNSRVVAVTRKGFDKVRTKGREARPFVLRVQGIDGAERVVEARAVIDASGTWTRPNPAGSDGLPAIGEPEAARNIFYGIPEVLGRHRARFAGKSVLVVGSGHSALNALVDLAELAQSDPALRITWAMRRDDIATVYGGEADDALPARGALGSQARVLVESGAVRIASPFRIERIARLADGRLEISGDLAGEEERIAADEMIVATGFRPDLSFLGEIRLTVDPWLESSGAIGPLIDPNLHSCGTVRPHGAKELAHAEQGFYIAGMKSYGRAPTFLLATGYEQVRSIVAQLAGDTAAAERVELSLPETGVCVARPAKAKAPAAAASAGCCGPKPRQERNVEVKIEAKATAPAAAGCCGGPAPKNAEAAVEACCADDALAKAAGAKGCGCGTAEPVRQAWSDLGD